MVNESFDREKTIQDIIQSLRTDERLTSYFDQFNPLSVFNFINTYAHKKAMWLEFGKSLLEIQSRRDTEWIDLAFEHLKNIQQQKLFETQCLWRAEQLTINEVEICYDFMLWEDDVLNCPFIDPISEDDINLYIEFLNTGEDDDFNRWQDYNDIKEAYHNDGNSKIDFPEWYSFCIARKGGSHLLSLPNIKEDKEEFYLEAYRKRPNPEKEKLQADWELNADKRPSIGSTFEPKFLEWFVKTYETPDDYNYYKVMQKEEMKEDEDYYIELVGKLVRADEPIPISANANWKEALEDAYFSYRNKKVIEYLPLAFEHYTIQKDLNINQQDNLLAKNTLRKQIIESINIGKKMCGETD